MGANFQQIEMLTGQPVTLSAEAQDELARNCKDRHDALIKCFHQSGLEQKEVYLRLQRKNGETVSQTQFSLFLNRKAYLPHECEHEYMRICGNQIPLRYDAWKHSYELKAVRIGLEAELEAERAKNFELEQKVRWLAEMAFGGRR